MTAYVAADAIGYLKNRARLATDAAEREAYEKGASEIEEGMNGGR